ncbi:hypothetical protein Ancab_025116 [Ancistrocladus abbreviatus]
MGPIAPALTARIPPDPRGQGCLVESGTGVGDPEGSALVGPLMIIPRPPQRLFARAAEEAENVRLHLNAGGGSGTKREGGEMGPIAPALTARIPPDPRGQRCLVESGTGVGDPEGSALVGPLMIIPRPPQRLFARAAEGERRVKNDVKGRRSGCDHTSTNAPDPIRTPQLSVLGRE